MKKIISIIFVIGLIITLLGCHQQNQTVTPTDSAVQHDSVVQEKAEPVEESTKEEVVETKKPIPAPSSSSQAINNTVSIEQPISQPAVNESPEERPDDCYIVDNPTFVSETALVSWIKNGSGKYESERANILQNAVTNQTIIYCSPTSSILEYVTLEQIEVVGNNLSLIYQYTFEDGNVLGIYPSRLTDTSWVDLYELRKQRYLYGEEDHGRIIANGIEYYYQFGAFESTMISWLQYGTAHSATIYGHRDQIDTLIPLLELEQVTVDLNNDHVTQ